MKLTKFKIIFERSDC